jgi:hypothetical protein
MSVRAGARPGHRRFDLARPTDRSTALALVIAAVILLIIVSPSIGGHPPGDPAAIAGDARLDRCGGTVTDVEYGFTIPHARDYQQYLPAMGSFSELNLAASALVVVYRDGFPGVPDRFPRPSPSDPTLRDLCIYVGEAGGGEINYYRDVSIAGLRPNPVGPPVVPDPQT